MSDHGRLFVPPGAPTAAIAKALSWLWRLGPVLDSASADAVGVGAADQEEELRALVEGGGLAGAVLFLAVPGPARDRTPASRRIQGITRFSGREQVRGEFTVFESGTAAVESSIGTHAVRDGRMLLLGADHEAWWSRLETYWILAALADFLPEVLERPLVMLPPVGVARLDDVPGTAQHQLEVRAKTDSQQRGLARTLRRTWGRRGACLNVAVAAEALRRKERVPLDDVWPKAVAEFAEGVREGAIASVCHGLLHLVPEALEEGRVDYYEFRELDEAEAGRRIDIALAWHERNFGVRPRTFVAPAWGYSDGAFRALAARNLPAWLPPSPGPLLDGGNVHETIDPALWGIYRLDYRPLARWAALGLPPTLVFHGRSFDLRLQQLDRRRDFATLVRLFARRDIVRVPRLRGVRWIGTGEFVDLLRAHDRIEVRGREVELDDQAEAVLVDGSGVRPARV